MNVDKLAGIALPYLWFALIALWMLAMMMRDKPEDWYWWRYFGFDFFLFTLVGLVSITFIHFWLIPNFA